MNSMAAEIAEHYAQSQKNDEKEKHRCVKTFETLLEENSPASEEEKDAILKFRTEEYVPGSMQNGGIAHTQHTWHIDGNGARKLCDKLYYKYVYD